MWDGAYYVTVDRFKSRQTYVERQFKSQDLEVEKFLGIDKNTLSQMDLEKNEYILPNTNLKRSWKSTGIVGCWLSHCLLWKKILEENKDNDKEQFLIFEDDAKLAPKFKQRFMFAMKHIPSNWDMVWLGHGKLKGKNINRYILKPFNNPGRSYNSQTHCYLIKKSSIEKILSLVWPLRPNEAIDSLLRKRFHKFNSYFVINNLATQNKKYGSTVNNKRQQNRKKRVPLRSRNFFNAILKILR